MEFGNTSKEYNRLNQAGSSSTHGNGERNTFLSRIFGLQSDDAKRLMDTGEMSAFPLQSHDEAGSSRLSLTSIDRDLEGQFEIQNQRRNNEELRVPESDQDTSSEEDNINLENSDMSQSNLLQSEGYSSTDEQNIAQSAESVPKIGQLSIKEDIGGESGESDKFESDKPIVNNKNIQHKKTEYKPTLKSERLRRSYLFSKYLNKDTENDDDYNEDRLFTPLENNTNTNNNNNKGNGFASKFRRNSNNNGNGTKSFIFQENTSRTTTKKRPNILRNIKVLNNTPLNKIHTLNPKEKALWKWANVENLDIFFQDVYNYYLGNGLSCIMLQKLLNLLTLIFVVYISTYLGYCIDYTALPRAHNWTDISQSQCYVNNITGFIKMFLWCFYVFVFLKVIQLYFDYKNLMDVKNFYNYLLEISDDELQTIPWQIVIKQMIALKDQNALTANVVEVKAKNRISAHDVANRIMRKENYLIALFNNDLLNLSLPIPFLRSNTLTKTLEWNINLCIMGYVFNDAGFIKQNFLRSSQREYIKEELQKRFMLAGFLNIILAPFLVTYFILLYFFKYFNEYKTSPGSIGMRQYTSLAEWKFREYNELYHIFKKRIGLSIPLADRYTNQFPKEKYNIIMKFIGFISGSFVAILAVLTIFDPEYFLNFEITNDRSVLFYLTVFGSLWTISHNSISKEYDIFEPEEKIKELSTFTHYLPDEWEGKYHTEEVKEEFCKLYNLRIIILLRELASLITTPFILWFSLPQSTDAIIDFFRDSSIYVDGLGYICKFAMFDTIKLDEQQQQQQRTNNGKNKGNIDTERSMVGNGEEKAMNKMMQSFLYFADNYENDENELGKYQLPQKKILQIRNSDNQNNNNYNYSWKKQFKPGQNPESFQANKQVSNGIQNISSLNPPRTYIGNLPSESFIKGSTSSSRFNSVEIDNNSEPMKKEGVLKLIKEYYDQSKV